MALTQITTTGIADDAITADKLPTNLNLIDNQKIRFGTSNDFEVYHDGTRSWVRDSGSGNLIIDTDGSEIDINSGGNAEYMARFIKDGSVELYYDNSKKIETKSYGVNMPDNSQLYFGTGDDLVIKHDGSNSYIVNATGALHIRNDGIYFKNSGGSESFIDCSPNAEVSLFYDNSKKIETTSWGVDVTGTLRADDISLQDSHILKIGSDNDLQLTHSGNDSTISKTTAGNLLIYVEEDFYLKHGTEVMLAAKDDGAVELYHNALKRLETTAAGVKVSRDSQCDFVIEGDVDGFGGGLELHNASNTNNAQMRIRSIDAAGDDTSEIRFLHDVPTSNSGSIQFWTRPAGGSLAERLRLDSTGDLHFRNAGTGHQGLKWYKDNNLNVSFTYGDGNANPTLNIYRQDSQSGFPYGNLIINTGSASSPTQALKLRTDKHIELAGNLIMASGQGIDFSATSDASGKSSELLDDYEEGTWTPTATSGTFAVANGTYTKIGRQVTALFVIEVHTTTSGNHMQFNGLPFTNAGNSGENISSIAYNETGNIMRIYVNGSGVAGLFWNDSTSFFSYANCSGDRIRGGVSYFA